MLAFLYKYFSKMLMIRIMFLFFFLLLNSFFVLQKEREPVKIVNKGCSSKGHPMFLAVYPDGRTDSIKLAKECKGCFVIVVEDGFSIEDKPMFIAIYPDNSVENITLKKTYSAKNERILKRVARRYKNIMFYY